MSTRISQRMVVQQDTYELFHDYWNLLTALQSYAAVLRHSSAIQGVERQAADEIGRLLSELERRTEVVRSRVLSMLR